jgi:vacuolar iron transporter family protein
MRNYVRDLVLGFNDGLVSVYAVTVGVAGAGLGAGGVLIAGVAASVAGAFSMAAGEYISTKSQAEFYAAERKREEEHLDKWPHLERQELRESFEAKGLEPPLLDQVVDAIASDREKFLDFMMRDEFGVGSESERSPFKAAGFVILAFLLGALFPVVPYYLLDLGDALLASSAFSLVGLFLAGMARARASRLPAFRAGLEMVIVGLLAALVTFTIGRLVGIAV